MAANKWCLYTHTHTRAHVGAHVHACTHTYAHTNNNGMNHVTFLEMYVHCWTKMQSYPIPHCLYVTLLWLWAFLEPNSR